VTAVKYCRIKCRTEPELPDTTASSPPLLRIGG
jgi:hypothetical protein